MKRTAFTMLELIFVIVVIGILATVAIPRLAATRDDAQVAKGRSDVAAIRSAIVSERQGRLLRGDSAYINRLDQGVNSSTSDVTIFDNNGTAANSLLMYGITTKNDNGHWMKVDDDTYAYKILQNWVSFDYNKTTGTFTCDRNAKYCALLID